MSPIKKPNLYRLDYLSNHHSYINVFNATYITFNMWIVSLIDYIKILIFQNKIELSWFILSLLLIIINIIFSTIKTNRFRKDKPTYEISSPLFTRDKTKSLMYEFHGRNFSLINPQRNAFKLKKLLTQKINNIHENSKYDDQFEHVLVIISSFIEENHLENLLKRTSATDYKMVLFNYMEIFTAKFFEFILSILLKEKKTLKLPVKKVYILIN